MIIGGFFFFVEIGRETPSGTDGPINIFAFVLLLPAGNEFSPQSVPYALAQRDRMNRLYKIQYERVSKKRKKNLFTRFTRIDSNFLFLTKSGPVRFVMTSHFLVDLSPRRSAIVFNGTIASFVVVVVNIFRNYYYFSVPLRFITAPRGG